MQEFLVSPIFLEIQELIKEHRDATYSLITDSMINCFSVEEIDMYKIAQYKGQIHTLDMLLDIEDFLIERLEVKPIEERR